ncbi:MAG: ATP-binding protein [Bacteroidetes bacterium QS_9_68_14]|nr:MAG: ATP-binding protein [Bacteroidetes bacterium QS_9_68_14]
MGYEQHFSDLDAAADEVQTHFQKKIADPRTNGAADAFCRLQLAVHEWIGNLIDHASFRGRAPEVHVRIWRQEGRLCCVIEDNSEGFDLDGQLDAGREVAEAARSFPEEGMGLPMLEAGTEQAEYTPVEHNGNRLTLAVAL